MSVQPIDIGEVKFKLVFHNNLVREYEIDPPIGWDKISMDIKRGDKFSRFLDIGTSEIELRNRPIKYGHQFDRLVQFHKILADESLVELIIIVDGAILLRTELDFVNCTTDRESFFKFKLITDTKKKQIEDRKDVKIDIFGDKTVDGKPSNLAPYKDIVLLPKKIQEISIHLIGDEALDVANLQEVVYDVGTNNTTFPGGILGMGNPWGALEIEENQDANEYFVPKTQAYVNAGNNAVPTTYKTGGLQGISNFEFNVATDFEIDVSGLEVEIEVQNLPNAGTSFVLQMAVITYDNIQHDNITSATYTNLFTGVGKSHNVDVSWSGQIPAFSRVIYEWRVVTTGFQPRKTADKITIKGGRFKAATVNIFPPTQARMVRLFDAAQRVINAISENEAFINTPDFGSGQRYWDSFVTSGSIIRGFTDSEFLMSYSDLKKFVQNAYNADVQINENEVYIANHENFYEDTQIAKFPFKKNVDSYSIEINKDLVKNEIYFGFETFEDNEKLTLDAFHTESEWYIPKRNEGKLEAKINFIADGYSIEYARRQGIESEPTTAKSKDDKIYVIDCTEVTINIPFFPPITFWANRRNQDFDYVEGIYSPETAYNLMYGVKRLMLDNYPTRLAEIGQKFNNGTPLANQLIAKNTMFKANGELGTLTTTLQTTAEFCKDNADVTLNILNRFPKIAPEIYNFTLSLRIKWDELIKLYNRTISVKGYITLVDDDENEISVYPAEMKYDWIKERLIIKGERKYEI